MAFDNDHGEKVIYTTGKQFRESLRRPVPKVRVVPAFTISSLQRNTVVLPPPSCGVYKPKPRKDTNFRKYYERGDFPISIENEKINWKDDLNKLDYHHYLPMFFEGLSEKVHPYDQIAKMCISEMLKAGGPRILPVVPQLIIPIKKALNTKVTPVVCNTLRILKELVMSSDLVGEALVPYYRQILPPLNLLIKKNVNIGDGIDYSSMNGENVGDLIQETLEVMERYGGEDAFINIKYMIPTYESCVLN